MKVAVCLSAEQIRRGTDYVRHVVEDVLLRAIMRNLEERTKLLVDPPEHGLEFQFGVRPHVMPEPEPDV
jgi:hypothetical protein